MVNGKAKGATAERELGLVLTGWALEVGVKLDLQRNLEQVRSGGHDLLGLELYGLAVECKRVELLSLGPWWGQACRQAQAVKCDPVLAWRQNRQPWRFRIREWVYPCKDKLVVDIEGQQFKLWFQSRLTSVPAPAMSRG